MPRLKGERSHSPYKSSRWDQRTAADALTSELAGRDTTRAGPRLTSYVTPGTVREGCVDCGAGPCRWNLLGRLRNPCMVPHNG